MILSPAPPDPPLHAAAIFLALALKFALAWLAALWAADAAEYLTRDPHARRH